MRIAISTDGDYVSAHFGRCPAFTIVDIENNQVMKKDVVKNPGHQPCFIPQFLHNHGVEYIICGEMGTRAKGFFDEYGIKTVIGVSGSIDEILDRFLNGRLKGTETFCQHNSGQGHGARKPTCHHSGKGRLDE
ncbi:MAG: NifB/NifX family molybdenum-iron cluster-binding protein [candidate division WOR-3 bacterium]